MSFSDSDFFSCLKLLAQAFILLIFLRLVSLAFGYTNYVPYLDDMYFWLINSLESLGRNGLNYVPRGL